MSPIVLKASVNRIASSDNVCNQNISLSAAIENFLSNDTAKAEILASYNDTVITAIQTNFTSLKLMSQALQMKRVHKQNLPIILAALAEDHGFDNIFSTSNYSQQLKSSRFSYENLFTTGTGTGNNTVIIKYIWILGELINNSTYTINFSFFKYNFKKFNRNNATQYYYKY